MYINGIVRNKQRGNTMFKFSYKPTGYCSINEQMRLIDNVCNSVDVQVMAQDYYGAYGAGSFSVKHNDSTVYTGRVYNIDGNVNIEIN